jgi:hypothetical protein
MDLAPHRQQVARALRSLESSIERLVNALAHSSLWIRVDAVTSDRIAVRRTCEAYAAIDYAMDDAVGSSVVCLGVLGVSSDIFRRAEAVNTAKASFKEVCAPLQHIRVRIPVKGDAEPTRAIPLIRVLLRSIQRSDLNLLAAYRKIPLLAAPPASVTYTRANTRSVYRKTIAEVAESLTNLEGPAAIADRVRLRTLDRHETHLALVRVRYQNTRANVLYARLDPRGRGRIQISAELPLMYAVGRRAARPEVRFPAADAAISGRPRRLRESQVEERPFLQSLPIHRYAHP